MTQAQPQQKHTRDDIYSSVNKLKIIGGLILGMLVLYGSGAVWVYKVDSSGVKSAADIQGHSTKIAELERWQIKMDAERFTAKEAGALSQRLSSLEQSNAEIYRTLQRIDNKLP